VPMGVFHWLLLVFFSVPLAEIYVLVQVGGVIGAAPTIAMVVLTAVIGAAIIRHQGLATLARVRRDLERGEVPAEALLEAAVLLIAGALLLTPGFVTDTLGFACLIPALRRALIRRFLFQRLRGAGPPPGSGPGGPRVIEGEFHREDD